MPDTNVIDIGQRYRRVDAATSSISMSPGNTVSTELQRSLLGRYLTCRLNGTINYSGATTVLAEGPPLTIARLELIADGRKTLWSASGPSLFRLSHILRGKQGEFVPITTATGPQSFSSSFLIDLHAQRMVSPIDSYFDPRIYEKVELRVTWAAATAMGTGGTLASGYSGTLDITYQQTAIGADRVAFNKIVTTDIVQPGAATTAFTQRVSRIGLLSGVLIRALTAGGVPSDTMVNKLSLRSDNNFLHYDNITFKMLQVRNAMEYQIDIPGAAANASGVMPVGYAFVDLTEDGMIASALNALDLNTLDFIFDVSAACTLELTNLFYEPVSAAA